MKRLLALGALIIVAGCASQSRNIPAPSGNAPSQPQQNSGTSPGAPPNQSNTRQPAAPGSQQTRQPARQKIPPKSASEVSSPAVMSLLGSADTLAKGGHMDSAASVLERALGLEPRNPFIYQRLAQVRLADGQTGQAEQMAMKSNSVSNNNPFVESGNWQLIAEARRAAGNKRGARQARAQAVNYRQAASQYGQ